MTQSRSPRIAGKVRAARLTDLAALGELSRLCEDDAAGGRSLGLPVTGSKIGVFSLFRLPLGAFQPNDLLFVYEEDRRVAGLVRAERESHRDDWTIVELDGLAGLPGASAGDIRFRLVQQVLRGGQKRGAAHFHVACVDAGGNVELFMQAGFARYGEERIQHRDASQPLPEPWSDDRRIKARIRAATPRDAVALMQLYTAVTPAPVRRLESFRIPDWERQGTHWRVPRSSLAPILRFADIEGYVLDSTDGVGLDGFIQLGVAREEQPHYLRVMGRPETDLRELIAFGLGDIRARLGKGEQARAQANGVIAPVRTYESPLDRRLEEAGFRTISTVTLLMKETLVRVAEPALVPAGVRPWEVTRGS
ncbi:MAG: hypothetical protein HYX54_00010 [Chloroflexi bacterium]|nr:hypothetical protein [Chloroflexota bacterium]